MNLRGCWWGWIVRFRVSILLGIQKIWDSVFPFGSVNLLQLYKLMLLNLYSFKLLETILLPHVISFCLVFLIRRKKEKNQFISPPWSDITSVGWRNKRCSLMAATQILKTISKSWPNKAAKNCKVASLLLTTKPFSY